jgi:hypothetical protein
MPGYKLRASLGLSAAAQLIARFAMYEGYVSLRKTGCPHGRVRVWWRERVVAHGKSVIGILGVILYRAE